MQTPGSNGTGMMGLLCSRQTFGLCNPRTQRSQKELVAPSFHYYLEIEACCRSHQSHSALSSTAFAGLQTLSWETGSSNVTVIYSECWGTLLTVSGWEGCSSLAEFQLQAVRTQPQLQSFPTFLACLQCWTLSAGGVRGCRSAYWPSYCFSCCICVHHQGGCWTMAEPHLTQ